MEYCQRQDQVRCKLRAFALAIYETIVFPLAIGTIDDRVIVFYDRMIKEGFNLAPAILVKAFHSLNYYQ